mmetsp:Transcript_8898/g.16440  ORF Transcript_8898/g.16440 Transcript_8898/m.16440 type:complete len:207 (-) Transcript_8898:1203-1823(-)
MRRCRRNKSKIRPRAAVLSIHRPRSSVRSRSTPTPTMMDGGASRTGPSRIVEAVKSLLGSHISKVRSRRAIASVASNRGKCDGGGRTLQYNFILRLERPLFSARRLDKISVFGVPALASELSRSAEDCAQAVSWWKVWRKRKGWPRWSSGGSPAAAPQGSNRHCCASPVLGLPLRSGGSGYDNCGCDDCKGGSPSECKGSRRTPRP